MKHGIPIVAAILALTACGCSKYGYVSLSFPVEPVATLPGNTRSIAVVNRSLTTDEEKSGKVAEAIISTEIGSDFLASDACVKGVYDGFRALPADLVIPEEVRMHGTGTRALPELLPWERVEEICQKEGADLLLVLETFDSNTDLMAQAATKQITSIMTTGRPDPTPPSQVRMNVAAYWRLYDPTSREIRDQYQYNRNLTFNTVGGAPPPDALPRSAYDAGVAYADRFLPGSYRVKRKLYQRTSGPARHQFRAGYRRTEVANWDGAMELWTELTDNPKRKTAGRASLNMAVSNEVLGHTDAALEWARRSYELYRDKLGRDYSKILLRRRNIEGINP
jgi:hypothetical protein